MPLAFVLFAMTLLAFAIGFGVIINYASYMQKNDDVVLSSLTSSATDEFFEVAFGGMITLTAAVVFLGMTATQANIGGTFSTGFAALPVVFVRMPWGEFFRAVTALVTWCYYKVLSDPSQKKQDEEWP